ncbi:ser/thr protein phosphatase superfamily [Anaeramoeba ignava]|uniref:Ser/thr protein phosphatase superfamily n=1 Tax=Anaeramoeba ignava TaxID=1746090 RepID=A0A9Q0LSU7_ANAIG|nr:ser/thr protein phosphatase superfamily [Anaeramoeba ignava]
MQKKTKKYFKQNYEEIKLEISIKENELPIQIASDIHLEMFETKESIPKNLIIAKAKILGLLGDIGLINNELLEYFLREISEKFEIIFFIAGNHEFYNHNAESILTYEEQLGKLERICSSFSNVYFLDNKSVKLTVKKEDCGDQVIRFLGTTLWSYIPDNLANQIENCLNDYSLIFKNKFEPITPKDTKSWFDENVNWIISEYILSKKNKESQVVVLSHHTPTLEGTSPIEEIGDIQHAFSSNLDSLLDREKTNISCWCCGHTHLKFDFMRNGTRVVSNPRGYYWETERSNYSPEFIIKIKI